MFKDSPVVKAQVQRMADKAGLSVSDILRIAVHSYLESINKRQEERNESN